MLKWNVKGKTKIDTLTGTFSVEVQADTLREAVEKVEATVPGGTVTSITQIVPYSPDPY